MRQSPCRSYEWSHIARHEKRLNAVLRIVLPFGIAPFADLHVYFAIMLVSAPIVECGCTENGGWLQMGNVPHHNIVGSVPQTSCHNHFRAGPLPFFLLDTKMEGSICVGPRIISVVQIVHSAAIAGNGPYFPVVATEVNSFYRCKFRSADALHDHHGND